MQSWEIICSNKKGRQKLHGPLYDTCISVYICRGKDIGNSAGGLQLLVLFGGEGGLMARFDVCG